VTLSPDLPPRALDADIVIIGGGLGGVAGALAALDAGMRVVMTEETDWIGGQLTSQATPPDENAWIEQFGCTARYRSLRTAIRDHYRRWYPLTPEARADRALNPGRGRVSRLCHEPTVAASVLDATVAPWVASGRLTILRETVPVHAEAAGAQVRSVTVRGRDGSQTVLRGRYFLDATELGDLIALAGIPSVTGFESASDTGEPSAPAVAQPNNEQAITLVFAMSHHEGEDHTITRPADYDTWRTFRPDYWPGSMIGFSAPDPVTRAERRRTFVPNPDPRDDNEVSSDTELWGFRRILARATFQPGFTDSDITIANWPMIDYVAGGVTDPATRAEHFAGAKRQSLAMFYWLQTEAPRADGGTGWPGLRLRGDAVGTTDGFAKYPYIRESRRIRALQTVTENDVSLAIRGTAGATPFVDSVGIGMYRIDLHPSTGGDNYVDIAATPFRIPLGALIPQGGGNLLAAAKNVGTTHITNGCFRLHPVEWNIGEAAGALAAHCIAEGVEPAALHADAERVSRFQQALVRDGFELAWPEIAGY
jgi:hypothetical protein